MKKYEITQELKNEINSILENKKFNAVFPYMNLLNREGCIYSESEINSVISFLSEFSYKEVAHVFSSIKENVKEVEE